MPAPDVVLELTVYRDIELTADDLEAIETLVQSAVPLGDTARALTVLSERAGFDNKILSIGLWIDDGGDSDAELEAALIAAGPLIPRRGLALLFTAHGLQFMASSAWKGASKRIDLRVGFLRLSEDIVVAIDTNLISTTVRGEYKIRFVPNLPFKLQIRERLDKHIPGSNPPLLLLESSKKLSVGVLKVAALLASLSPALGALTFWKGDELAEKTATIPETGGAGEKLAAQWPAAVLTDIAPPARPGKFTFLWTELIVDVTGVRTLGAYIPAQRAPEVFIRGPQSITLQQPHGWANVTYEAVTQDLRHPLRRRRWIIDGASAGRRAKQNVSFGIRGTVDPPPETRTVRVEVTDADGLVVAREVTVNFQVVPAEGHRPL